MSFKHGSLFSGIGGFDLAAEWMGWENVFHCENAEFQKKLLKQNFPNSIGYDDVKTTDFTIHRGAINILSGGFPCQPYSVAGKQKGTEDDRHLWPYMLRAIKQICPSWVVGENVRGLVNWNGGLVFHEVQADLEAAGYEVFPFLLPAAGVGAPHERYRIWFIAYSNRYANRYFGKQDRKENSLQEICGQELYTRQPVGANTGAFMHSYNAEQQGECLIAEGERELNRPNSRNNERSTWGSGLLEPPIRRRNDGLSEKLDEVRVMALGNAIVPQVAHQIFKAIEQYEKIA